MEDPMKFGYRRSLPFRPAFLSLALCCPAAMVSAETGHVLGPNGKWEKKNFRTVAELKGFRPAGQPALSKYGGLASRKGRATGFFRTGKVRGRWWLVDPEGHPFLSVGLCSVNHSAVDRKRLADTFGDEAKWAIATGEMLRRYGFNTLGCWSDADTFRATPRRMPYTPRWNFMATYKNRRSEACGARGYPRDCIPVFDRAFETFCDAHAAQLARTKDDPWLLGHFSDNELPFRPDGLTSYLKLPASDPGHQAARKWWHQRREDTGAKKIHRDDQDAFREFLARRYYSVVSKAIRKYDPNHLYLGSRLNGRNIHPSVFRGAKGHVGVMSINYYHRWSGEQDRMKRWVACSGVPFIVSEWYAQSLATPDAAVSGAGFRVRSDRDRGLFYQNMTLSLLANRGCVGWHWFKYGGDGRDFHKGVVSNNYRPHTDLLELMGDVNGQVYALAEFFLE
jgi:hypothetical protein